MTLTELQQVKKDIDNNVIVSKTVWLKVLETAIEFYPEKQRQSAENGFMQAPTWKPSPTMLLRSEEGE